MSDPLEVQVGGDHYKRREIQPIEIINLYDMNFNIGNSFKYVSRHGWKNGLQDLEKAAHYIEFEFKFQLQKKIPDRASSAIGRIFKGKTKEYLSQFKDIENNTEKIILAQLIDYSDKDYVGYGDEDRLLIAYSGINCIKKQKYGGELDK